MPHLNDVEITYSTLGFQALRCHFSHLLIVDIEHTCTADDSIPPEHRETIEIGAVIVETQHLTVIDEFSQLIKPLKHPKLSEFCRTLTGIQQVDIDNALPFGDVFQQFIDWYRAYDSLIFCSWGAYDAVQLGLDCECHQLAPLEFSQIFNLKKAFAKAQHLKKRVGMQRAMELVSITPRGQHHRGLDDVKNIVRLLPNIFVNEMAEKRRQFEFDDSELLPERLFRQHGDTFTIDEKFLSNANEKNGSASCVGFYWNECRHSYDPIPFSALRDSLAKQGYITLNQSQHKGWDDVNRSFTLNSHPFKPGEQFRNAACLGALWTRSATVSPH